ncbi:MAG: nicotinate (nicotinamide) nucleotide adenylyltransferase [candidate division WOR-3 bacterium]
MKIGIFGGRFDPIHMGHLIVAQDVLERLGLDRLVFLPSFHPPHKGTEASYEDRLEMIRLGIGQDNGLLEVSDLERRLALPKSYTVDILEALRKEMHEEDEVTFLVGTDEFANLPSWHKPERLFKLARVAVLARAIKTPITHALAQHATFVPNRVVELSSSEIRERVKRGMSIRFMVPEPVREYILKKGLYAGRG